MKLRELIERMIESGKTTVINVCVIRAEGGERLINGDRKFCVQLMVRPYGYHYTELSITEPRWYLKYRDCEIVNHEYKKADYAIYNCEVVENLDGKYDGCDEGDAC